MSRFEDESSSDSEQLEKKKPRRSARQTKLRYESEWFALSVEESKIDRSNIEPAKKLEKITALRTRQQLLTDKYDRLQRRHTTEFTIDRYYRAKQNLSLQLHLANHLGDSPEKTRELEHLGRREKELKVEGERIYDYLKTGFE